MTRKKRPESCGLGPALEVIGGKWKAVILWEVCEKPLRFGELRRRLPDISEKMLIQHLRELEAHGVIHRKDYQEVPPRVEYSITSYGKSLNDAIAPLAAWGRKYEKRILAVSEE